LAKYLGEGTSRKEAEEKSSAFFILERVLTGNRVLLTKFGFPMTQNVIFDAGRRIQREQERAAMCILKALDEVAGME